MEQFWNGVKTTVSGRVHPAFADGPVSLDSFRSALPELRISKRRLRQLEAIQLVREQRDTRTQDVSYNARPFVLCGLPLRRPPADQLVYTRHNGSFVLEITAHPRFGLPYGQDRLIPIWMATLSLKQKSRVVHFESPTQLLDYFHLPKDGAQYRRVKAAFQRIFSATVFFGTKQDTEKQIVVDSARFHFMDSVRLWFNSSGEPESAGDDTSDNTITLSEAFYQEIAAHPIPVEREVIAALAHDPVCWTSTSGSPGRAGRSMAGPLEFQSSAQTASAINWARLSTQSIDCSGIR